MIWRRLERWVRQRFFFKERVAPKQKMALICALLIRAAGGTGYLGKQALEAVERREEIAETLEKNSEEVLAHVLSDRPLVIRGAVDAEVLARTREAGYWAPGDAPDWFLEALDLFTGLRLDGETIGTIRTQSWGCKRPAKQCAVAWWYSGSLPTSYQSRGAPTRGVDGAFVHTDAVCAPSWSLQIDGTKLWTLSQRTPAESFVPIGDEFFSNTALWTVLEPGDLLFFFNGWQPHATSSTDPFTASVHGLVDFPNLPERLWSDVRFKTPSTRLLAFCPDVRNYGGFQDEGTTCRNETLPAFWKVPDETEFGRVAKRLGHLAVPAAFDVDDDSDRDLVVGLADGTLLFFENVGTPTSPAFADPVDLRLDELLGPVSYAAPSFGQDGTFVVGVNDGRIAVLTLNPLTLVRVLTTNHRRPGPLVLGPDDILIGAESGDILRYRDSDTETHLHRFGPNPTVLRFSRSDDGLIIIGDASIPILRFARLQNDALIDVAPPSFPWGALDLDALADAFEMDAGAAPAPLVVDFTGDGHPDLLLGDHYGNLFFFDAARPLPRWEDDGTE